MVFSHSGLRREAGTNLEIPEAGGCDSVHGGGDRRSTIEHENPRLYGLVALRDSGRACGRLLADKCVAFGNRDGDTCEVSRMQKFVGKSEPLDWDRISEKLFLESKTFDLRY